ncbi:MAG: TIR domain-containing protein [Lachnospiraceae bacterium]|nr:TIR domain-containing protein [Lachnospiraceae bacterium]
MEYLNCRCCGGALDTFSNLSVCKHCGATNFISDVANRKVFQLNRANKLRQEREFDNAARIYDNILEENEPTADILWYRTLCEYGIEYVPDPISDKYIPTLHRINDESIFNCDFFKKAIELSEGEQKITLLEEAKYIDGIQTKYLNIAANEAPYDVFICYKETDLETGEKTEDVKLAEELFNELVKKGYKVFFARETLKEKLSIEYEPYIFAALKSSKVMVVVGTKAEYFTSVWVKNEWGRFLKLMEKDRERQIFFACDDPEELPRAFAFKQAQILGNKNAIKNLAENVDSFLKDKKTYKSFTPDTGAEGIYNEACMLLESGKEKSAKASIETLLDRYPNFPKGYWLRMLYSNKARPSDIRELPRLLEADPDYNLAITYASGELKEEYIRTAEICKENLKYQDEFSKILREKSAEYVRDFDNSEKGIKRDNILDSIRKYCNEVDTYNNKLRLSFAVGYPLFYFGLMLFIFITLIFSGSVGYLSDGARFFFMFRNLICEIVILFGIAVGLSYNMTLDIGVTVFSGILLTLAVFFPEFGLWLILFATAIPVVIFVLTYMNSSINTNRCDRENASAVIINELEKLKDTLTKETYDEMIELGIDLSNRFKEEKGIESVIEIKEEDYKKELEKLENIYQIAKEEYAIYIEVSFPKEEENNVYNERGWNQALMGLVSIPVFGPIGGVIDILTDKYNRRNHAGTCLGLFFGVGTMILLVAVVDVASKM